MLEEPEEFEDEEELEELTSSSSLDDSEGGSSGPGVLKLTTGGRVATGANWTSLGGVRQKLGSGDGIGAELGGDCCCCAVCLLFVVLVTVTKALAVSNF